MGFSKLGSLGRRCPNVISAIANAEIGRAPIYLVYDILRVSFNCFDAFKSSFVRRGGNAVAYMMARWETNVTHKRNCMAPFPDCLRTLVEFDLS